MMALNEQEVYEKKVMEYIDEIGFSILVIGAYSLIYLRYYSKKYVDY